MFDMTLGGVLLFRVGFEKDIWLLVCCLGSWLMAQQEQRKSSSSSRSCRQMLFFEDFRRHVRQFFGVVLELARPSEARCFPPAGDFFEAVLLQQPQATEAVEKCCFSRISDDTLGSFLAWFWN